MAARFFRRRDGLVCAHRHHLHAPGAWDASVQGSVRWLLILACAMASCAAPSSGNDSSTDGKSAAVTERSPGVARARAEPIIDPRAERTRLSEGVARVDSLPFEYSATSRLIPSPHLGPPGEAIQVDVSAANHGSGRVKVQYGDCAVELSAYREDGPAAEPVWRSSARSAWPGGYVYGCALYLANAVVEPGAAFKPKEFTTAFPVAELLADSLPDGEYHFAARARLNWGWTREIPAGRLRLSMPRGALPSSRVVGVVTYDAWPASVAAAGKEIVFSASATVAHAGSSLYRVAPACAIQVLAYRDRALRDALPPVAESWRSPAQPCGDVVQVALDCGESYRLESRARPSEILGDSLPAGDYYFAVVLRDERRTVRLSAGAARLNRGRAAVLRRAEPRRPGSPVSPYLEEHCLRKR